MTSFKYAGTTMVATIRDVASIVVLPGWQDAGAARAACRANEQGKNWWSTMYDTVAIETGLGDTLTDITDQVRAIVKERVVESGVCILVVPHTTAAVTINSGLDPATPQDIISDIRRLVPTRTDFHHSVDTPSDAAAHIKASIIGNTEMVLIENGDLVLGHSQSLLFFDFDGPRKRRVMVKIIEG